MIGRPAREIPAHVEVVISLQLGALAVEERLESGALVVVSCVGERWLLAADYYVLYEEEVIWNAESRPAEPAPTGQ